MENREKLNIQIQQKLVEELTNTNRQLFLINSFASAIQDSKKINNVLAAIHHLFDTHYSNCLCDVFLKIGSDNSLAQATPKFYDGNSPAQGAESTIIHFGEGIIGRVAKKGVTEITYGSAKSGNMTYPYTEIAIPMLYNNTETIGVIYSKDPKNVFFNENNIKTLGIIASIAATKIIQINHLEKIANYQMQLEEYVKIVSHDLRSPLRAIDTLLHWIKEDNKGQLNDETLNNIDLINTSLSEMENMTTKITNYSIMDWEPVNTENVDLNLVIQKIKQNLNLPSNITLTIKNSLPTIAGNEMKFFQIFQNIIQNAITAIDKPSGLIEISSEDCPNHHKFVIRDNGIGINQKYFHKIFQVFQSLTNTNESSGIGLSIAKKLVNSYEGKIWLESKEGVGSTFFFTIRKGVMAN